MAVVARAPGKLFLAGEYAVVEPGQPALIMAVDRYLTVTVTPDRQGWIVSDQEPDLRVTWERQEQTIITTVSHSYQLIVTAMQVVESYLREKGVPISGLYGVQVASQLDDAQTGIKYGLGSSGAVTVATVKAVLLHYAQSAEPEVVYKLAALTHILLGKTGSLGDIAASSYGGVILYQSCDKAALAQALKDHSLVQVLEMDWKGWLVEAVDLPEPANILVGWTGAAASTDALVQEVKGQEAAFTLESYEAFLAASGSCVRELVAACRHKDMAGIKEALRTNRKLLQVFAQERQITIETPALALLCQLAEEEGAAAKTSGAGGGDCGICLVENERQAKNITQVWEQAGIIPLPLAFAERE